MTAQMKGVEPAWGSSDPMPSPTEVTAAEAEGRVRLILVDDDDDYREAVAGELMDMGFEVTSFGDGPEMLAAVAEGAVAADVIVLDWGLPSLAGIDLLPRLRREGIQLPVVFLTGRSSLNHENLAFDRSVHRRHASSMESDAGDPASVMNGRANCLSIGDGAR